MSSALPYLQKQRKTELTDFAVLTHLPNYSGLRKPELEAALDDHLRANSTSYSKEPTLSEYYKRLDSGIKSPIKRIAEKVSDIVKSDDDVPAPTTVKRARRKTKSPEDDLTDTDVVTSLVKTPAKEVARRSSAFASQMHPPSPAVVADVIDYQTRRIRHSVSHAVERTQIQEYIDSVREVLSTSVTINILAIALEAYGLRSEVMPNKLLTDIPAIPNIKSTRTPIYVPDLFQLVSTSFWAPVSLWILTTIVTPAVISYFINLPLKQLPNHSYATRQASLKADPRKQFDPFVFNLAKGVVSFLILAHHFRLGIYQHFTIALVNSAVPGGYYGILITSGLAAAVSLYEAVLKSHKK